jgi:hypothetical protein
LPPLANINYTVPGKKVPGDKKAYEVVIQNVIKGEHSSFVREDELVAGWKIFTPFVVLFLGPRFTLFFFFLSVFSPPLPCRPCWPVVGRSIIAFFPSSLLKHIESPNGPTPAEYAYGSAGPEKEIKAFEEKLGVYC